ncbi:response regulator [Azospirillum sp.]|uniref:response regulator n=1 Tax=Azospirillum sp. TaxID=34012 RepID=UPI002D45BDC4|nr:response regulator [Azospirillum sp.]HYD69351.1 response regulator [Azospirillum sp.]
MTLSTREPNDDAGPGGTATPRFGRRGRLAVLLGSSALAGLVVAGAMSLATGGALDHLRLRADRDVDNAVGVLGLAEAASRLAAAMPYLEAAPTGLRRQNGYIGLRQQTQQVIILLDELGRGGLDRGAVDGLRRLVNGMDSNLEDLNHVVERRIAIEGELRTALERVPERHAAFRGVLSTLTEQALRALRDGAATPQGADLLRLRDGLEDLGRAMADQLFAAAGLTHASRIAERQKDFRATAGRLGALLDRLPIDAASARRAEAARQLMALGVDAGNVFELRAEWLRVADAVAEVTRNSRDKAAEVAQLARRTAAALRRETTAGRVGATNALDGAPTLAGLVAALAVLAGGALALSGAARRRAQVPPDAPPALPAGFVDDADDDADGEDADGEDTGDAGPEGPPPLRVLLADDEPVNQMVCAALLRREGHAVTVVGNGRLAVEAVAGQDVDLVLMDLRMPEMDGIEAVRRIRALADPARAGVRIAMLTASAIPQDAERCRAAGADAVLPKPLQPDTLRPLLERLFATGGTAGEPPPPPADGEDFSDAPLRQMREALPADRVAQLIGSALAALDEHHATLAEAGRRGDRAAVAATAHRIAGVAGVYGCLALRRAAQALEVAAEGGAGDMTAPLAAVEAARKPARTVLETQRAGLREAGAAVG